MFKIHPLASIFPRMPPDDFAALVADIARNGQQEPIAIYEDQILDGIHRYEACLANSLIPETISFDTPDFDPRAYVTSRNLSRRHLTPQQRAAVVQLLSEYEGAPRQTVNEKAAAAAVSRRTMIKATTQPTEILQDVAAGRASLASGVKVTAQEDIGMTLPEAVDALTELTAKVEQLQRMLESDDQLAAAALELAAERAARIAAQNAAAALQVDNNALLRRIKQLEKRASK